MPGGSTKAVSLEKIRIGHKSSDEPFGYFYSMVFQVAPPKENDGGLEHYDKPESDTERSFDCFMSKALLGNPCSRAATRQCQQVQTPFRRARFLLCGSPFVPAIKNECDQIDGAKIGKPKRNRQHGKYHTDQACQEQSDP